MSPITIPEKLPPWIIDLIFSQAVRSIIAICLGAILSYLTFLLTRRLPSRLAWRLADPNSVKFFVATSDKIDTGEYFRYVTGVGQLRAIGVLVPSFIRAYSHFDSSNIILSEEAASHMYGRDVVIIGGPKNNAVAKQFLDLIKSTPFTMDGNKIIDASGGNAPITGSVRKMMVDEDFGLVIRCRNPFDNRYTCLLLVGAHTYGTHAAAVAFAETLTSYRYAARREYACLVKTTVSDGFATKPAIVEMRKFTS